MLELHVGSKEVQNPTVNTTWCVDKETLTKVAKGVVEGPKNAQAYVLFVVRPQTESKNATRYESRVVVPLKDGMAYLPMRFPGANRVFAKIVIATYAEIANEFLSRHRNTFTNDTVRYEGEKLHDAGAYGAAVIDLIVPEQCFAKPPSEREAAWVNLWFKGRPEDQCDFRRRRMLAYTLQPLVIGLACTVVLSMRLIGLGVLLLYGARVINFRPLLKPWQWDDQSIGSLYEGTVFLPRSKPLLSYLGLAFMPWVVLLMAGATAFFTEISFLWSLVVAPMLALALFATCIAVVIGYYALSGIRTVATDRLNVWRRNRRHGIVIKDQQVALKKALQVKDAPPAKKSEPVISKDVLHLVCNGDGVPALPRPKTFRLRFLDLKSKVCRPYAN